MATRRTFPKGSRVMISTEFPCALAGRFGYVIGYGRFDQVRITVDGLKTPVSIPPQFLHPEAMAKILDTTPKPWRED